MKTVILSLSLTLLMATVFGFRDDDDADLYWPQWRGPQFNGSAPGNDPPIEWDEGNNIKWKTTVPGEGSSTPIIWKDRIYLTTAVPSESNSSTQSSSGGRRRGNQPSVQKFVVMALDRDNGKILWKHTVREGLPHAGTHSTSTWASNSATTDGKHLYAYFGSQGLYCLDLEGNLIWKKDLGNMNKRRSFGEGSSPVLYQDRLFLIWDHEGPCFLFAIDKQNGEIIWKKERDEISSWSSPLVVEHDGKAQLITSASRAVRSYDPMTGKVIWEASGLTENVIPMPVQLDGLVIVMSGFRGSAGMAIRLAGAQGNLNGSDAIAWEFSKDTPYTPSPLLYDETLYFLKGNSSILTSLNARTGEVHYGPQRLEAMGNIYSSPVGASGRVYISDRDGNTMVIRHGPKFEILATNSLNDGFDASAVIVDDEIFLRGRSHLYCISETD